jgi:hypothetical protein
LADLARPVEQTTPYHRALLFTLFVGDRDLSFYFTVDSADQRQKEMSCHGSGFTLWLYCVMGDFNLPMWLTQVRNFHPLQVVSTGEKLTPSSSGKHR